jgi:hypothetical protein
MPCERDAGDIAKYPYWISLLKTIQDLIIWDRHREIKTSFMITLTIWRLTATLVVVPHR